MGLGYFAGCFPVFRGAKMTDSMIKEYDQMKCKNGIYRDTKIKYFTSCSQDFMVAYQFASQNLKLGQIPVLIVILLQNYIEYRGFRLNDTKYSQFTHESEVLLNIGIPVYILDIEDSNIMIKSQEIVPVTGQYYEHNLKVIYMLNLE